MYVPTFVGVSGRIVVTVLAGWNTFADHQLVFGPGVMLEDVACLQGGLAGAGDGGILRWWR